MFHQDKDRASPVPSGTRLTKDLLDQLLQGNGLDRGGMKTIFLDLYEQKVMEFENIATISGSRGIHIVPPKWCKPIHQESPEYDQCYIIQQNINRLKRLACLPLCLEGLRMLVHYDTGSALTLHAKSYRTDLPQFYQIRVIKVCCKEVSFSGILGRQTSLIADVYRWEFGWSEVNSSTTLTYSQWRFQTT